MKSAATKHMMTRMETKFGREQVREDDKWSATYGSRGTD